RGLSLTPSKLKIAANGCHCNTGGSMTLTQLGLILWDDLAAPIIAGIVVSIIVSWMHNQK
ncbi:type I toxin-antitoxin system toxin Ldr family protein, partial [Actinotignum timonense]